MVSVFMPDNINICNFEDEIRMTADELGVPEQRLDYVPPFAVVASNYHLEVEGRLQPIRPYSWGACQVTKPSHSDFQLLK